MTVRVGDGQTLITGGWSVTPGKRTFLFTSPGIQSANGAPNQVLIQSTVLEVPEELLAQFGMDQFKIDGHESSLQNILTASDAAELIKALSTTEGVEILSRPRILTSHGVTGTLFVGNQGANRTTANYTVGLTPNITTDGTAVDLSLNGEIDPPGISSPTGQ